MCVGVFLTIKMTVKLSYTYKLACLLLYVNSKECTPYVVKILLYGNFLGEVNVSHLTHTHKKMQHTLIKIMTVKRAQTSLFK